MKGLSALWRRLTHNLGWKLGSLGVAVLLWLAVIGQPELMVVQPAPLLYRNLRDGLILGSEAPAEVRAELRGPSGRMNQASLAEVFVSLDLGGVSGPGEQTFTLSSTDFSLPAGVSFARAIPSQVRLRFDRTASRQVPVLLRTKGAVPEGYRLSAQKVSPDTLWVSGPEVRVDAVQNAETDLVDLSGLNQTTEMRVNAFVPDGRVQFESSPVVTIRLEIEKVGSQ